MKTYIFTTGDTVSVNIDGYLFLNGVYVTSNIKEADDLRQRGCLIEIIEQPELETKKTKGKK